MNFGFRALFRGIYAAFSDEAVRGLMTMSLALISAASIFYWYVEKWSLLDSVYFSVITIATVGYGDFSPQTSLGKLFTIGYVFCGLGLFVATASSIANRIIQSRKDHS